jgi:autophagy-related protein 2
MEMMKLGARLATGTQVVLEKAEGVLSGRVETTIGGEDSDLDIEVDEEVLSRYANQPGNTREGIQAGYTSLSRNINSAAQTILAVPMEVYERSGDNVSDLLPPCLRSKLMTGTPKSGSKGSAHSSLEAHDRRF